jgi:hypothetical protein
MRLATERIMRAFRNRESLTLSNTRTDGTSVWLFGNKIIDRRSDGIWITNAGWNSNTTRERLNGLENVHVQQKNFQWYLNARAWDGRWVNVERWDYLLSITPRQQLENLRAQGNEMENFDFSVLIEPTAPEPEPNTEPEIEFDVTNVWIEKGQYSKPLYSVTHKLNESELEPIEKLLNDSGVPTKRMESDTSGVYKPNYFIVVLPNDYVSSIKILKENEK